MSLTASLASSLQNMGFAQLVVAMFATIAYALLLNASLASRVRALAGLVALTGAVAFSILTPSWMSGAMLMALVVAAFAMFAAAALVLSSVFGLTGSHGTPAAVVGASIERTAARPALAALRQQTSSGTL